MNLCKSMLCFGLCLAFAQGLPYAEESESAMPSGITRSQRDIVEIVLTGMSFADLSNHDYRNTANESLVLKDLEREYPGIKVEEIQNLKDIYVANQIRANRASKEKWMLLPIKIKSIRESEQKEVGPNIVMSDIDSSNSEGVALFKNQEEARDILESMDKGQQALLICQGDGFGDTQSHEAIPKFKNCVFFTTSLLPSLEPYRKRLVEALKGKGNQEVLSANAQWALLQLGIDVIMGERIEKQCHNHLESCVLDIASKLTGHFIPEPKYIEEIMAKYHELGYTNDMLPEDPKFDFDELMKNTK